MRQADHNCFCYQVTHRGMLASDHMFERGHRSVAGAPGHYSYGAIDRGEASARVDDRIRLQPPRKAIVSTGGGEASACSAIGSGLLQ